MKVLEECSALKILKIGRQSNKHFSYTEESKILKQLKKLQLRKFLKILDRLLRFRAIRSGVGTRPGQGPCDFKRGRSVDY